MWQTISGFSDYIINEHGCIYRRSTHLVVDNKPVVSLKADSGEWRNKSVKKLVYDTFERYIGGIVAENMNEKYHFKNIKEAAQWLIESKRALVMGNLAAYNTVRTNIKHGITQPGLYPLMYGYSWKVENERRQA